MSLRYFRLFSFALSILIYHSSIAQNTAITTVPLAGNTFFSNHAENGIQLTDEGITNWTDPSVKATIYVRFLKKGQYKMALIAKNKAKINVSIQNISKTIKIKSVDWAKYPLGTITVADTGYIALKLSTLTKNVAIKALEIQAPREILQFVGDDFYFGRRGPSVHLSYKVPANKKFEWFYNEVTVPKSFDVIGSYYMANGFQEGYFGIQVNSATERRILFSVWSPFSTDDPKSIPDSLKIILLKKGKNVYTGEFGNEGSGGQSYLKFNWKSDITYSFLTRIRPNTDGSTTFTSYFFDTEKSQWLLIASFKRPKTNSWYTRPHSFLENFDPDYGAITHKGFYTNQWVCDTEGIWTELTTAQFTNDATARKKARMDFAGGVEGHQFFLKNCGFFSQFTPLNTILERPAMGKKPQVIFNQLPSD